MQFGISAGSSLRNATQQMVQAGVLPSAVPFEVLSRLLGDPRNIKAGNYEIEFDIQGEGEVVQLANSIRLLIAHLREATRYT